MGPNKLYHSAAMLINDSEKLFQRYERICQGMFGVNGLRNPVREWTGDCQKLHDLFGMQESRMKLQITHLLSEASSPIGDLRAGNVDCPISREIWGLFANEGEGAVMTSSGKLNEKAWTKMARQALNDIQRLLGHVEES